MNTSFRDSVDVASARGQASEVTSIVLLGASFKTAPIDFREYVVARMLNGWTLKIPLDKMGVLERSVIETCNRIELYLVAGDPQKTAKSILPESDGNSAGGFYLKIRSRRDQSYLRCGLRHGLPRHRRGADTSAGPLRLPESVFSREDGD
jgi:hypothetical protein